MTIASTTPPDATPPDAMAGDAPTGDATTGVAARDAGLAFRGPDRRRRATPMLSRFWLRGRRRGGRRAGEMTRIYVDVYSRQECALFGALLLLSLFDLGLTIGHVSAGGAEANPLMAWALQAGGLFGFVALKAALTLGAAVVLLLHVRFPLARHSMVALLAVYVGVMAWHGVVVVDRVT